MEAAAAFGVATGIIGLLPLCANGCTFIMGICKASGGVQEQIERLRMQRGVSPMQSWLLLQAADSMPHRYLEVNFFDGTFCV